MKRILNYGSLNVDCVYAVDHFVRAGETLSSRARTVHAGGKGLNQSLAASRAGGSVFHAGKLGADGAFLRELLEDNGVDTRFVANTSEPSGHAIIQVDKTGQNAILLCPGANHALTEDEIASTLSLFGKDDTLMLQNEVNGLPFILKTAQKRGMKIVLNPSPITDDLLTCPLDAVSLFVLNEIEGKALTGQDEPRAIIEALRRRFPQAEVLLTLGADGSLYADARETVRFGIFEANVQDTTAAGDTLTGYFVALRTAGASPEEALKEATRASAWAVSHPGAAPSIPTKAELADFCPPYRPPREV